MHASDEAHLRVLKILEAAPNLSQRQLASRLGISLGKTNFLVRALLEKGLIKVRNFQRAPNKLRYAYLLTPRGIGQKLKMTKEYLARKEAEYEALQDEIRSLKEELQSPQTQRSSPDSRARH